MGRLIDADICLNKAWQNFYKQEDEHEKNIDGYDILRDRFYEQSGFKCCQQTIVNAPTVEAIPKDQYEAILKADYVSKKKIAQATNKIIKCSLGKWYAGRVDGKTEEVVLMDDVLHIMQGLLNEKEQINEN